MTIVALPLIHSPIRTESTAMAHEQRREKMTKKPKKDTSPPKALPSSGDNTRPTPGVTAVIPRGKEKKK